MLDVAREMGFRIRTFHHALEAYKIADVLARQQRGRRHLVRLVGLQDGGLRRHPREPGAGARRRRAGHRALRLARRHPAPEPGRRPGAGGGQGDGAGHSTSRTPSAGSPPTPPGRWAWTRRPARLEVGKMADVVVWSHPPLSVYARPEQVFVDGHRGVRPRARACGRRDFELGTLPPEEGGPMIALVAVTAGPDPGRRRPRPLAIEHARIHAGDGKAIEDGTLVVTRRGQVAALGPAASVTVPAGARRIDGKGLWLTPGLIDAESSTGLADVYMEKSTGRDRARRQLRRHPGGVPGDRRLQPAGGGHPDHAPGGGDRHGASRRAAGWSRGGARPCACAARACRTWWCDRRWPSTPRWAAAAARRAGAPTAAS